MQRLPLLGWFAVSTLALAACGDDSGSGGGGSTSTGITSGTQSTSGSPTTAGSQSTSGSQSTTGSQATAAASTGTGNQQGTAGCGTALAEPTEAWNPKTVDVDGVTRDWFVWLPVNYDPNRPYPVVYQFHGCSDDPAHENNNVPIQNESGGDAIIVRGRAVDSCWDTSNDGPDVHLFDAMVSAVEASYCADDTHRFVAGYSSGSFMTHVLACQRGAELRGVASIAGGQTGSNCTGNVAALLIHDTDDPTVNISQSLGARDQYLAANGCGTDTQPFDPDPCVEYQGCSAGLPVVWCQTSGHGHDRQDGLAAPAFWNFFSSL